MRFNVDEFLRGDTKARGEFYRAGIQNGWLSLNDVAEAENQMPRAGGDVYFIPKNVWMVDSEGNFIPEPASQEDPPDEEDEEDTEEEEDEEMRKKRMTTAKMNK